MLKYIIFPVLLLVLLVVPFSDRLVANTDGFSPIVSSQAWEYGEYRVERLAFTKNESLIIPFGSAVLFAEPKTGCLISCDTYRVFLLKNGVQKFIDDVDTRALRASYLSRNDGRFVYAKQTDDRGRMYDVVEINLDNGTRTVVAQHVEFTGAVDLELTVDGEKTFFNTEFDYGRRNTAPYRQATVFEWDKMGDQPSLVGWSRWQLNREEIVDVQGNIVLVKMVFESGHKQLWTIDRVSKKMEAVPLTWTEPHAELYGTHFQNDGTIEYFQYFTRYTYKAGVNEKPVVHETDKLNWFVLHPNSAIQILDGRMAWVDPDNRLRVSSSEGVVDLGSTFEGRFTLEPNRIFYASGAPGTQEEKGTVYHFTTGRSTHVPLYVSDSSGDHVVGEDGLGHVMYYDLSSEREINFGFGSSPAISDDNHVYWRVADSDIGYGLFEATLYPQRVAVSTGRKAIQQPYDKNIYLVAGNDVWLIPSEVVFLSWFDSFDKVQTGNPSNYAFRGNATFKPGTKVKETGRHAVYVVGADGKLHWIVNPKIAAEIYGATWNKNILEVRTQDLIDYQQGIVIDDVRDLEQF